MTKKEIKNKYKIEKRFARMDYRAAVREADKIYRYSVESAEESYHSSIESAEERYNSAIEEFYRLTGKKIPINPPKRPVLEEIGNSITHGLGAAFSIVAVVLMLTASDSAVEYVSAIIYFVGMFFMFMSSCLYHAFAHGTKVKRLFHRFDYDAIYLLIGATFAPVLLCHFGDLFGYIFFVIQWTIIATGVSLVSVFGPTKLRLLNIPLYILLGWSALMLLPDLISTNFPLAMWVLGGGVVYTVGIIPFTIRTRVAHFIWHFFVLAGAVVQWIGIYLYLFK